MSETQITRTAEVIASEIVSIKETARTTLQAIATGAAVEIGKRLKEAKSLVPYGEWGTWLKANVDYSERTANVFSRRSGCLPGQSARCGVDTGWRTPLDCTHLISVVAHVLRVYLLALVELLLALNQLALDLLDTNVDRYAY